MVTASGWFRTIATPIMLQAPAGVTVTLGVYAVFEVSSRDTPYASVPVFATGVDTCVKPLPNVGVRDGDPTAAVAPTAKKGEYPGAAQAREAVTPELAVAAVGEHGASVGPVGFATFGTPKTRPLAPVAVSVIEIVSEPLCVSVGA